MNFNASASYDRDGFIASCEWNFGDGNVTTTVDQTITHVYTAVRTYTINLTVIDNDGLTHSITKCLGVGPFSTITLSVYPAKVNVGSNVTINGTITPTKVGVNVTVFYRLSGGTWDTLATVKTDSNSQYTYTWKTIDLGKYEIKASWEGDEDTLAAESDVKTVTVKKTWTVDDDGPADFHTIQEAIDVASAGDSIYVHNGTYYEYLTVTKSDLAIVGENKDSTVIENWGRSVVNVTANKVTFTSFTVRNPSEPIAGKYYAIYLKNASYCNITNNIVRAYYGWGGFGIFLDSSNNNSISNNNIANSYDGIDLYGSSNNSINGNIITANNMDGIDLYGSFNNSINGNNITNNSYGIELRYSSSGTTISGNNITNNDYGIYLYYSSNNIIYHNNFINNTNQVYIEPDNANTWDDGYPSGGNYWSDYAGVDEKSGSNQDQPGSDGIGDTPYIIDVNNRDRYPLMDTTPPTIETPSRIPDGDVLPGQTVKVSVNVTDVLSGVKNVTLSYTINDGPTWTILPMNYNSSTGLYEAIIPPQPAETWVKYKIVAYDYAGNNATLDGTLPYCTYQVIPEFPPTTILPLFIILSIVTVIFVKLKKKKQITS